MIIQLGDGITGEIGLLNENLLEALDGGILFAASKKDAKVVHVLLCSWSEATLTFSDGDSMSITKTTSGTWTTVEATGETVSTEGSFPVEGRSTFWWHLVPYCDSIQHAFNTLRWRVFQGRQYQGDKTARSIYALRRAQVGGTHSILDMQWVAAEPDEETVSPLSAATITAAFGTMKPTVGQVLSIPLKRLEHGRRGGNYIIAYDCDRPSRILFWGVSGKSV